MINKSIYILKIIVFFSTLQLQIHASQPKDQTIRIGVKNDYEISSSDNLNYLDQFESRIIPLLEKYLQQKLKVNTKKIKIEQSKRVDEIQSGENIDILLYSFSKTEDREKRGILFSDPYFRNHSIVLATLPNIEFTIDELGKKNFKIGYVRGTTGNEINKLQNINYEKVEIFDDFDNYDELKSALKKGDIDGLVGDMSRIVSDFANNELRFAGILPTQKSKIGDNYYIAISNKRPELKSTIDAFIKDQKYNIDFHASTLYDISIDDAMLEYHNKSKKFFESTNLYLSLCCLALFLFLVFISIQYGIQTINQRREREKSEETIKNNRELINYFTEKNDQKLDTEQICDVGVKLFNSATKNILYVGSVGLLSAPDESRVKWRKGIDDFLKKDNVIFERIIDLPKFEIDENRKMKKGFIGFPNEQLPTMYFNSPDKNDKKKKTYVQSYIEWLLEQYYYLLFNDNIRIYDSRAAALWGSGIVVLIKDSLLRSSQNTDGLYITTYGGEHLGAKILAPELAKNWGDNIRKIISGDKSSNENDSKLLMDKNRLKETFFEPNYLLKKCAEDIEEHLGYDSVDNSIKAEEPDIDNLRDLISKAADKFNDWFYQT